MISLEEHLDAAKEEWESRKKFLKSGEIIHGHGKRYGFTDCGLSVYQWEEYPWEWMPLSDSDDEITCKNCLRAVTAFGTAGI